MSESSRKRRKPAKPSRHSPNSQSELSTSTGNSISPPEPHVDDEKSTSVAVGAVGATGTASDAGTTQDFLAKLVASQNDIDSYMSEKRTRMMSSNDAAESESRSESPQDSLDLSLGSRSQTSPISYATSANNPSDAITNPLALLTDQTSQLQSPSLVPTNKKANATCKTTKHPPTNTNNPPPVLAHPVVTSSPHLGSSNSSVDVGAGGEDSSSIMTQYEELKSKAMTSRARRIIANARERNRVHTISSAFEQLRRSIPCYSGNQKLSKLAILKIATSYIRCLSHVATREDPPLEKKGVELDPGNDPKLSELVMKCTVNVLSDGKLKRSDIGGVDGGDRSDGEDMD